jgi:hypothetical protein
MDTVNWALIAIFVLGVVALAGFFQSKTKGFGRFSASTLLMLLVLITSALLYAADKLDSRIIANVFFAVIGFAGGLFTGKETESSNSAKHEIK